MITIPSVKPVATRSPMAEYVQFGTTKSSGIWGGSNSAYFLWKGAANLTVEWGGTGWSGGAATQTYTGTASANNYYAYISRTCSGVGDKTVKAYPTDSSGRRIGKIVNVLLTVGSGSSNTRFLSSVDVKNATELEVLYLILGNGTITSIDVSGLKRLYSLVAINGSVLDSVNVAGCTSLQTLNLRENTSLTSLDVSNFTALYNLDLYGCSSLTSLRAQNVMLYTITASYYGNYIYSLNGGANLQNTTAMTTAAMEQFYTDLATETTGFNSIIAVYGSGGVGANTTIATDKNYTVIGNVPP